MSKHNWVLTSRGKKVTSGTFKHCWTVLYIFMGNATVKQLTDVGVCIHKI